MLGRLLYNYWLFFYLKSTESLQFISIQVKKHTIISSLYKMRGENEMQNMRIYNFRLDFLQDYKIFNSLKDLFHG